jgi:hypothetical protein
MQKEIVGKCGYFHRSGREAMLFFGSIGGLVVSAALAAATLYQIIVKGEVSAVLAGWMGTIIGFYFSQLAQLVAGADKNAISPREDNGSPAATLSRS